MVVVVVVVVMQSWVDFEVVVYTLPNGFGHVPHMYAENYPADFDGNLQIGRASCRERVCT